MESNHSENQADLIDKVRRKIVGAPRDIQDSSLFHKISLIPFLAWIGLGADGLSSSAYGPDNGLPPPWLSIESGSMEHPNSPFGRLGTIDAGDMVLVQKVTKMNDVVPHGGLIQGAEAENGWRSYGDYGDVIIYKPLGRTDVSQIIHRAMCWVDVYDTNGQTTYTIVDYGIDNETSLNIPQLGLYNRNPGWTHSGFLTKGDIIMK